MTLLRCVWPDHAVQLADGRPMRDRRPGSRPDCQPSCPKCNLKIGRAATDSMARNESIHSMPNLIVTGRCCIQPVCHPDMHDSTSSNSCIVLVSQRVIPASAVRAARFETHHPTCRAPCQSTTVKTSQHSGWLSKTAGFLAALSHRGWLEVHLSGHTGKTATRARGG